MVTLAKASAQSPSLCTASLSTASPVESGWGFWPQVASDFISTEGTAERYALREEAVTDKTFKSVTVR
jgi:hypothetical protein